MIWVILIAVGLAVGFVVAGLGAHPKADPVQIAGGTLIVATVTVFVLSLLRFLLKNLGERRTNG